MGNRSSRRIGSVCGEQNGTTTRKRKSRYAKTIKVTLKKQSSMGTPVSPVLEYLEMEGHSTVFEYAEKASTIPVNSAHSSQTVQQRLELLSTAFEYAPDCIIIMQNDIILAINPAGCKFTGWESNQLVGADLGETLIPAVYRERHRNGVKRFVETGVPRLLNSRKAVQVEVLHKDARTIPIHLSMSAVRLPNNEWIFLGFLRDISALIAEMKRKEQLLHSIMPKPIATRMIEQQKLQEASTRNLLALHEHELIADSYDSASVGFLDMVGFTRFTSVLTPTQLVTFLNDLFSQFDDLFSEYEGKVEKIKTMGDAVMFVSGLPERRDDHTDHILQFALHLIDIVETFQNEITSDGTAIRIRIGLHSGPLVAAVVGTRKPLYDIYGDTVNVASRMESSGEPGKVQVSREFLDQLMAQRGNRNLDDLPFSVVERGRMFVKGKGEMESFLVSRKVVEDQGQ